MPFNNILDDPQIYAVLKSIAVKQQFEKCEFVVDKGSNKGDGYLSNMTIVQINSKLDGRVLNLVLKRAQSEIMQRTIFPLHRLYLREIRFYDKIFPAFEKFQNERKVREPFAAVPKYFGSGSIENKEFLIMENIRADGFQLWNKKIPLTREHAFMLLKNYAKMHAISFAMLDQRPELFNELTQDLNNLYVPPHVDVSLFGSHMLAVKKAITLFNPDKEKKYFAKLQDYKEKVLDFFRMVGKRDWENGIITHGDSWMNNFMFKYEKNDPTKTLIDVKIFDFQFVRKVSPVLDIGYLIYMNTDYSLYNNYKSCVEYYYENLIEHGRQLGTDIEKMYSFETLMNEWAKYSIYGLLFGLIGVGIMLQEEENVVDLSDLAKEKITAADIFFIENNSDEAIRRMRNLVIHFVDNNFI